VELSPLSAYLRVSHPHLQLNILLSLQFPAVTSTKATTACQPSEMGWMMMYIRGHYASVLMLSSPQQAYYSASLPILQMKS
jgi:hypothetical protein